MEFSKSYLEQLATEMSIGEMAAHLKMAKSTLYYYFKKFNIKRRSKSDAQKFYIQKNGHQRVGTKHSDIIKCKISESRSKYWDSIDGQEQREHLSNIRKEEWEDISPKEKREKIAQLRNAPRPKAGDLSNFGLLLVNFLIEKGHTVIRGKSLTDGHISDIILDDQKIVIELIPPVSVYGEEAEQKLSQRYDRLIQELNNLDYRVLVIEQISTSLSRARCQRVYNELSFKQKYKTIKS